MADLSGGFATTRRSSRTRPSMVVPATMLEPGSFIEPDDRDDVALTPVFLVPVDEEEDTW